MVDDNEPASIDALTAQGGFLAQTGASGTDPASDLARRYGELQARYRGVIDRLPAVLYIDGVNEGDRMVDVGPGILELLGMTREEWLATSEGWRDVLHPDDLDRIVDASERTVATGEPFREQYRAIHRDGHEVWIREEAIRVDDEDGNPQFWLGLMLDVTDTVRTERELQEAQAKYGVLVEQIPAIVYVDVVDERMTTSYVSPQIEGLLGITPEEYIDDPDMWVTHLHPEDRDETLAAYLEGRTAGEPFTLEYRLIGRDGRVLWFSDSAVVVHDAGGQPLFVQGVMLDITQRKEAEEQIAFLAYHDKLTGLPNRAMFDELLELSLARARRHGLAVSVISLDIDNFKLVNDSLGHEAGNELIALFSERLREATREADLIARPGADEFLMLLADMERTSAVAGADPALFVAESVAARVQDALRVPFEVAGTELYVTASLGISVYPNHGETAEMILRHAGNAMVRSKQIGPGGSFMHSASSTDPMGKLSLSTRLRKAVENQSWMLHYQPLIDLSTGSMIGVEALIRWPEPGGGLIQPGRIHPAGGGDGPDRSDRRLGRRGAESTGRIVARGRADAGHQLQPVAPTALAARRGRPDHVAAPTGRHGAGAAHRRDHRIHCDDRPGQDPGHPAGHARSGPPTRDRRLRHRLLVARAPEAHAGGHPEDRPVVRAGRRHGPGRGQHGLRHDRARAEPGHDRARRRDRDGGGVGSRWPIEAVRRDRATTSRARSRPPRSWRSIGGRRSRWSRAPSRTVLVSDVSDVVGRIAGRGSSR